MNPISWLFGVFCGLAIWIAFSEGQEFGKNEVLRACSDYGRYEITATTYRINCVGPYDYAVVTPEYKPYDPALVKRDRKFRK